MPIFATTKTLFSAIFAMVRRVKLQPPKWQSVWFRAGCYIHALLVSITRSVPIGAVMLFDMGEEKFFGVPEQGACDLKLLHINDAGVSA